MLNKFLLSVALMLGVANVNTATNVSAHGGVPVCIDDVQLVISSAGSGVVSGIIDVEVRTAVDVDLVRLELGENFIGRAARMPADSNLWIMKWDTRYATSGAVEDLSAEVTLKDGNVCESQVPVAVEVNNEVQFNLRAKMTPESWTGAVGENDRFVVEVTPSAQEGAFEDVSSYVDVDWSTTIRVGRVTRDEGLSTTFTAGPKTGRGEVQAIVGYGGSSVTLTATTDVTEQEEPAISNVARAVGIVAALAGIAGSVVWLLLMSRKRKTK